MTTSINKPHITENKKEYALCTTRKEEGERAILKKIQVQGQAVAKYYATSLISDSAIVRFSVYELSVSLALVFLFPSLRTLRHLSSLYQSLPFLIYDRNKPAIPDGKHDIPWSWSCIY